jgi:preprotein translocase subunit SecE
MATVTESRPSGDATRGIFSLEPYKRTQGRRVRQLTAGGLALLIAWGLKSLADELEASRNGPWIAYGVPLVLGALCALAIWRLVNWPRFADFLIATEAEMTKVSWSTQSELKRATAVVIVTLFLFAGFLFAVDLIWRWVLETLGVLVKLT